MAISSSASCLWQAPADGLVQQIQNLVRTCHRTIKDHVDQPFYLTSDWRTLRRGGEAFRALNPSRTIKSRLDAWLPEPPCALQRVSSSMCLLQFSSCPIKSNNELFVVRV